MSRRVFDVAMFEFRRFFDLKGEIISILIIALIAGVRFGGEAIMTLNESDDVVTVAVEATSSLELASKKDGRFRFAASTPSMRDARLSEIATGKLDALVVPSGAGFGAFVIHIRDEEDWVEGLKTELIPLTFRMRGASLRVPNDVLSKLETPPEFSMQVHAETRSGPRAIHAVTIAFMVIVVMGVMGSLSVILQGIASEKFGRISEMVLTAIPVQTWIDGKLIAATLHGIKTTIIYSFYASIAAVALGFVSLSVLQDVLANVFTLSGTLAICALGLLFWSCGFAAVAALMPNAQSPVKNTFVLMPMAVLLLVLSGVKNPDNPFMVFLSYFPASSPFAMPVRLMYERSSIIEVIGSLALLAGCCYWLRSFAIRIFRNAVMSPSSDLGTLAYLRQTLRGNSSS